MQGRKIRNIGRGNVGKTVVTINEVFNLSTVCWNKVCCFSHDHQNLKNCNFFFLHLMLCFSVMKSSCSTLKVVVPGFSPQRPGFDLRAVYVGHSTATPKLTTNWSYNTNFLKKISFRTSVKMSLKFHFELPLLRWRNFVLIVLQQKDFLLESPSMCRRVYIPPHFLFLTYDQFTVITVCS